MSEIPAQLPNTDAERPVQDERAKDAVQTPERQARFEQIRAEARVRNAELMRRLAGR